jgi:SpoVK/Ycf46/Vps4 family AAA+-type ATPase
MLKEIQTLAGKIARDFKHDRVTDVHVLLAWAEKSETLKHENLDVIKLNLREKIKNLINEGLAQVIAGSDIAITERAREYLKVIAEMTEEIERFTELVARSGIDTEKIVLASELVAAPKTPLPGELLPTLEESLEQLEQLVGLNDVKRRVKQLVALQQVAKARADLGQPAVAAGMNLVFAGDPGTGKTTVARLIAHIYRALGLLSTGHLVEVGQQDLVAEYVGQTAVKTMDKINEAMGGVLFIDEAYSLVEMGNGGYGREAVSTLVKAMEDNKDNLAVIVAGYTEPMMRFIKSNPGLQSRFSKQIYFENYNATELLEIFKGMAGEHQITAEASVIDLVRKHLERNRTGGDNGNGRYARKLFIQMFENLAERAAADGVIEEHEITAFQPEDVPGSLEEHTSPVTLEAAFAQLDALVGLDNVKERVRELVNVHRAREAMDAADLPQMENTLNLVFSGDPGTGKTTVARIVAQIYQALGVLPRGQLIEVGRQDLVAAYVGQTAIKTEAKVDEAMGGVLFIDEAYSLTNDNHGHSFGDEAVATLVQLIENRRGQFALIAAGYKEDMRFFLERNPGLKSRMDHEIYFPNYTREQLFEIFEDMSAKKEIAITEDVKAAVLEHLRKNDTGGTNGNGRYVRKLFDKMCSNMATRAADSDFDVAILSKFVTTDVPESIHDPLANQRIGF